MVKKKKYKIKNILLKGVLPLVLLGIMAMGSLWHKGTLNSEIPLDFVADPWGAQPSCPTSSKLKGS